MVNKLSISPDVADKVSLADYDRSSSLLPLLRKLTVQNHSDTDVENIDLYLTCDSPFISPRMWKINSIKPGELWISPDCGITFLRDKLPPGSNEAILATLTFELKKREDGTSLDKCDRKIEILTSVQIIPDVAGKISLATYDCNFSLLHGLDIHNQSDTDIENVDLCLECDSKLIPRKLWSIDRIKAGEFRPVPDRRINLSRDKLLSNTEAIPATLTFELKKREDKTSLVKCEKSVEILAYNEWGGGKYTPELLAFFVTPNDQYIKRLCKKVADTLENEEKCGDLEGYQKKNKKRVYEMLEALWRVISSEGIHYSVPPASFESNGQKIRLPEEISQETLATCLDMALLFASVAESMGLQSYIVLIRGHALVGVALQPFNLGATCSEDVLKIRKEVGLKNLILFETVMATQKNVRFSQAVTKAARIIENDEDADFELVVSIQECRKSQIKPFSGEDKERQNQPNSNAGQPRGIPDADDIPEDLGSFGLGFEAEDRPQDEEGRIQRWKGKLLDITARNRLLNLSQKVTATIVPISCPQGYVGRLEDKLSTGREFEFKKKPDNDGRVDGDIFLQAEGDNLDDERAMAALEDYEIFTRLEESKLERNLTELYRKAKADLEESGTNSLFMAIGMLYWSREGDSKKFRAPLILYPVNLERKSARSKVKLKKHGEDEPVFNLTLIELFQREFGVRLDLYSEKLPRDESGIDINEIFTYVRQKIRDMEGCELKEELVLSTFTFAKHLLYHDLENRLEQLKENRFVKHLIETPQERYPHGASFGCAREIDRGNKRIYENLFMPLDVDSSQILAIDASARGGDFVLEGPPGTGKSQTIANIIAHNLAQGRKILFLSEKMAALEVVYKRLRDIGLGTHCLELHSNKTDRRKVLNQLGEALNAAMPEAGQWQKNTERLGNKLDILNDYVDKLHSKNQSGISVWKAINFMSSRDFASSLTLDWGGSLENDDYSARHGLNSLLDATESLENAFRQLQERDRENLFLIGKRGWSYEWQERMENEAVELGNVFESWRSDLCQFLTLVEFPQEEIPVNNLAMAKIFIECMKLLRFHSQHPFSFILHDNAKAFKEHQQLYSNLTSYRQLKSQYFFGEIAHQKLREAPVEKWHNELDQIQKRSPLVRRFAQWRLKGRVADYFLDQREVDIEFLSGVSEIKEKIGEVDRLIEELPAVLNPGIDGNLEETACLSRNAWQMRKRFFELIPDNNCRQNLICFLDRLPEKYEEWENSGMSFQERMGNFLRSHEQFENNWLQFVKLGEINDGSAAEVNFDCLRSFFNYVRHNTVRLNEWCNWNQQKESAKAVGLGCLVSAVEQGEIDSGFKQAFEMAYYKWLTPKLIDGEDNLREFNSDTHQAAIKEYNQVEDERKGLASDVVRSRIAGVGFNGEEADEDPYAMVRSQLTSRRSSVSTRKLLKNLNHHLYKLTPCLLMSPLSVAQYLPADSSLFDLVIFDEASQIAVWDAVGAISRGKNVIIVGDPQQMPPTNFFQRGERENMEDDDWVDQESILDEAIAAGTIKHRLICHYRSKHESLIAFSNYFYYQNELVTYPANTIDKTRVRLCRIEDGLYSRGADRTNPKEAQAIVEEVKRRLEDPELCKLSIGIVTLNLEQQRLIENLLDDMRRNSENESRDNGSESLEKYFNGEEGDPVFVKSLETVQGDERDVILLSIGYGPTEPGAQTMSMNFGPLNRQGGERRLNVAITRATTEMLIYCSFDSSMIDLTRTSATAVAVKHLKKYLKYAETGDPQVFGGADDSPRPPSYDSEFEKSVAQQLRAKGWEVRTQVGVGKFRIDLGVINPNKQGEFLAGIECDGATYHSSPTARDRDRNRQMILERLGWKILRIWSVHYFRDRRTVIDRVDQELRELQDSEEA